MKEAYSHQSLLNISDICYQMGVTTAVVSPGSRVAPMTLAFTRHTKFETYTISDERSAAFIGLGIAQQKNKPVILCCTSGTAALNYAPAVAEAFYQQVPLIIMTTDRPPEWIGQEDGQIIKQQDIYQNNCKYFFSLPSNYKHPDEQWYIRRNTCEAIDMALSYPTGPVHINIPIRVPFYPAKDIHPIPERQEKIIRATRPNYTLPKQDIKRLRAKINQYKKLLIIIGQQERHGNTYLRTLDKISHPVLSDIIGNGHSIREAIRYQDAFLQNIITEEAKILQPQLLITFGRSVISKNLKLFLREYQPREHWHIQPAGQAADSFQSLTDIIRTTPNYFFKKIFGKKEKKQGDTSYKIAWSEHDKKIKKLYKNFFNSQDFSELEAVQLTIQLLPKNWHLHLANSMSVRYANLVNGLNSKHITVFANRGTSGIDGSTSTFMGHTIVSEKQHLLITGDMAFFYDRNAFWQQYMGKNIKILLLNNRGSIIFNLIDGPSSLPEGKEYFITQQKCNAELLAQEYELYYQVASNRNTFKKALRELLHSKKSCILELHTSIDTNTKVFKNYQYAVKCSK